MGTIHVNTENVNSAIELLFNFSSIILTGEKHDINKFREKLLTRLSSKGIRNIHCIINKNIIELT